jgi:hypothetical protein
MKCELKNLGLLLRVLARFIRNHAKDVFGARAYWIPFKRDKPRQTEVEIL